MITKLKRSILEHKKLNAFFIDNKFYTYYELEEKIIKIQDALKEHNQYQSKNIGIVTNNDLETYASILAIWFSGLSYIPISPRTPKDRNSNIIVQAEIKITLSSTKDFHVFLDEKSTKIIQTNNLKLKGTEILIQDTDPEDLSYTLFTSGSTGVPKGVPINRKNIEAFVESFLALDYKFDTSDKFLQMFELTFDVSVACTLIPLLAGACVYTIPSEEVKYTYIYKLLSKQNITFATLVPSVLAYLKPYFKEINLPYLKYCILTAEASYHNILLEWQKCIPNAEIWNLYGPTEATIWCLAYRWIINNEAHKQYNGLIPIGKTIKNVEAIIVNDQNELIDKSEKGELCISGTQITRGYLNNATRNSEAFFCKDNVRYYKTGDLCFENIDGDIMYCGRLDNQVQIQGFRVELGEIEHHVRNFTKKTNIVAIPYSNNYGNTEICLFVEGNDFSKKDIMLYLKNQLPAYMLPGKTFFLDKFPVNQSNKIDRIALKNLI